MKLIPTIILSALILSGCAQEKSLQYANDLDDCLSAKDVAVLNEAVSMFEAQLTDMYGASDISNSYRTYLGDIQTMKVPPTFFVNEGMNNMLERMKKTGTFDKIWMDLNQIDDGI